MGQAKLRGSLDQRIAEAKARIDALRPAMIVCNECKGEITDIMDLPTRGLPGIDVAFAGICPACGCSTYAVRGEPGAVESFLTAMVAARGIDAPLLGQQE